MKFKWGIVVVFCSLFFTSLVAYVPAAFVWKYLPKGPDLSVSGMQGSVWSGSVQKVMWKQYDIGQVYWSFQPTRLFSGQLGVSVRFGQNSPLRLQGRGVIGWQWSGAFAENMLVSIPTESVLQLVNMPLPLTTTGQLDLVVGEYTYQAPYCQSLQGTLAWANAKVESPLGNLSLGPMMADLGCNQGEIDAQLKQRSSDVSGEWQAGLLSQHRYRVSGWFKPGANFSPKLNQQLQWLDQPDSKGRYSVNLKGRW